MPATSMELHIFGQNTLTVLVWDCLECMELPGSLLRKPLKIFVRNHFSANACLRFNADDYSRADLTSAWTLFSLVWPVVWHEQWMWVYAKIKDWSDCINCCPTILNVVMILYHLWTPSLLFVPQFAVKIVRVISKHFQARLNDWQTLWWRAQHRRSTKLTGGICSPVARALNSIKR